MAWSAHSNCSPVSLIGNIMSVCSDKSSLQQVSVAVLAHRKTATQVRPSPVQPQVLFAMATSSSTGGTSPMLAIPQWQCQASHDHSWTDYPTPESDLLEVARLRQTTVAQELAVNIPGWPQHVVYLGVRLQQVNFVTGHARTIRRVLVLVQGRPGGWASRLPLDGEEPSSDEH